MPIKPLALQEGDTDRRRRSARSRAPTSCATRAPGATSIRSTTTRSSPARPGMPSVFSHGLLSAGLLGQHLARWVGLAHVRSFAVRFTGQVWPGDMLVLAGRVARVEESGGERLAHLELTVTRQTGDVAVKGKAVDRSSVGRVTHGPGTSESRRSRSRARRAGTRVRRAPRRAARRWGSGAPSAGRSRAESPDRPRRRGSGSVGRAGGGSARSSSHSRRRAGTGTRADPGDAPGVRSACSASALGSRAVRPPTMRGIMKRKNAGW